MFREFNGLSALSASSADSLGRARALSQAIGSPLGLAEESAELFPKDAIKESLRELSANWQHFRALRFIEKLSSGNPLPNFIAGQLLPAEAQTVDILNPATASRIAAVSLSTYADLVKAVSYDRSAQEEWGRRPVSDRVEVLHSLHGILEERKETLAYVVHLENGKTPDEARAEVDRGIACVKTALALPLMMAGMASEVSRGVDCQEVRFARGVVAGITPFNFPVMVPLWMAPLAIGTGNSFILKPSEQTPISAILLAQYFKEAGLPDGVFSVLNGAREVVEAIAANPDIRAVGFVGSSQVAQLVQKKCLETNKPFRGLGAAKNHLVVMPDANPDVAVPAILNSFTGCAGQRCMAGSVLSLVGEADHILEKLVSAAAQLKLGETLGPVISEKSLLRTTGYIETAEKEGNKILLDGRTFRKPDGNGYFIGPTIIDGVRAEQRLACEEIFGPVLSVVRHSSIEHAISAEKANPYGNAACIFTSNPGSARQFQQSVSSAMVGVNVGVPVPSEPFSFGGMGYSLFGEGGITGMEGMRFWTQLKKVTSRP